MALLYSSLPEKPGVYIFKDRESRVLYVGKANNLKSRVSSYFRKNASLGPRTIVLAGQVESIDHILVNSEIEALLLEAKLIKKFEPQFNVRWTDGKAYPFIKITIKDTFPAVLQARKIDDAQALFFGPFPNIGDVRKILKWLRKIFPYQSVKNHPKRKCLYYHLGLCPCPTAFTRKEQQLSYKKNVRYIVAFLDGRKDTLLKTLEKEMKQASRDENFEDAASIKRQLETIKVITSPMHGPSTYIDNPNLLSDEADKNIESLSAVLREHRLHIGRLSRIECYDVSNIQGKNATGSMVVAIDGQIDKGQYRRFRIRFKNTPDDVAMHREMLTRRLKHPEWTMPDLIVMDGGITQANTAMAVLAENRISIPVIGLAKRLEEIIVPASQGETLRGKSILLPGNHRGLQLLQRLRDEAHRFAITYHRKLRRKKFLPTS